MLFRSAFSVYQLSNPGIESVSMTIHISHRGMVEFNKRSMDWRGRRVSEYERCVTALIHFLLLFKSKSPPSPSESKSLLYTSVSFLLSCIQGQPGYTYIPAQVTAPSCQHPSGHLLPHKQGLIFNSPKRLFGHCCDQSSLWLQQ